MKDENEKIEKKYFSTGSDLLDLVVGGGMGMGFPAGNIINIVGDKSSGKSFLACEIIAKARHVYGKKFKWVYDDAESGFTFDTERLYGFDILNTDRKSRTVEELYCNYREFLDGIKEDEVGIYVVDSLDGLSSREIQEIGDQRYRAFKQGKDYEKGSYQMGSAKFLSQEFFRTLTEPTYRKNVLLIIISQTREAINSMFKKQKRAGGKALDFYAHTCLWLSNLTTIKKENIPVGVVLKAKTDKSKTPRPYRSCLFTILFDYGVDNIGSNIDFLYDLRGETGQLSKAKESEIVWGGKCPNLKNLKEFLEKEGMLDNYKKNVRKVLKKSEIIEWINENPDLKVKYEKVFGKSMSREELIEFIEAKGLQAELTKKVVEKWEEIEERARIVRKSKY